MEHEQCGYCIMTVCVCAHEVVIDYKESYDGHALH